jgi:hypothetical protein
MALMLGLLAVWFTSPIAGPTDLNVPIGLEFSESIPTHDRAPLQDGFARTLPLACERAIPCIEGCSEEVTTVGLALDGSERNYTLHWVATDPRLDDPMVVDTTCELCSLVELEQQFAVDLTRVCSQIDALDTGPGQLILSSDPQRARVRIDGQKAGRTPWSGELNAGQHTIELRAFGHRPQRHSVAILGNVDTRKHYQLSSSFARRGRPDWPGWTSLGLGIAMAVAGTALISVHGKPWTGRCTGDDIDVEGNCRFVLKTRPLGIALTTLGAGAIAGGVGLMIWAQRDPAQTSAGLNVSGRF